MDKIRVIGGRSLSGSVEISGAKNASLPAMAASLLTQGRIELENVPPVRDILTMRNLLRDMGSCVEVSEDGTAVLQSSGNLAGVVTPAACRADKREAGAVVGRGGKAQIVADHRELVFRQR